MPRKLWIVAALLAGCSDPATDRLPLGSKVVVVDPEGGGLVLKSEGFKVVQAGTIAVVAGEQTNDIYHYVRISIKDGEHAGVVGELGREHLRPVP